MKMRKSQTTTTNIFFTFTFLHRKTCIKIFLKNYSLKPVSNKASKILKVTFNVVESFHSNIFFYSGCKIFWIVQNSFSFVTELNEFSVKKKEKSISAFDFSTLYPTMSHKILIKVLSEVRDFVLQSKLRKCISFLKIFTGLLRELEEDTSLNKLLSMLCVFL